MATVKVWNIKASSHGGDMKSSIDYITDSEKTSYIIDDITGKNISEAENKDMLQELGYISNSIKTCQGMFTGAYNCNSIHALEEMNALKEKYGKTDGRLLSHFIISFKEDENNLSQCFNAVSQFARELSGENYQCVFAMHTNTDNIHGHILVNTVGLNGRKLHMDKRYVSDVLQPLANKVCRENGLSENTSFGKKYEEETMTYAKWNDQMRHDIDKSIEKSADFYEFKRNLWQEGYIVNVGKSISLRATARHKCGEMKQARRTGKLGSIYTPDMIEKRIMIKEEELVSTYYNKLPNDKRVELFAESGRTYSPMKKYSEMSWIEKEMIRAEYRKGNNPWERKATSWTEFRQAERTIQILSDMYSLHKYKCYELKDIPETIKKIRELQKQNRTITKSHKEELKIYKPMIKIFNELQSIEHMALLYDLFHEEEYKKYADRYHELCQLLQEGYGHSYEDVYRFVHKNNQVDDNLKYNKESLDEDYKACIRIVKNYKDVHHSIFILGNLNLIEPKDITQILSIDALGEGVRNIEDIKDEIKSIDDIEMPKKRIISM